jgi:PAS domain S-box-containing protein
MGAEPRLDPLGPADAGTSLAHFASIVENSDDAILTKDRDGVITSWNPAAARMYGHTREEAIGRPISILIPEHRAGEEHRILARILSGQLVEHYETERVTKSGRMLAVSLSVSPLRDGSGEIVGASVIARDISERVRTQELAARLQEVTAALSQELEPDRVLELMLDQVTTGLGASAGTVGLVEGEEVVLAGQAGHSDAALESWQRFPLTADVPMSMAIRSREAVYMASAEQMVERFPAFAGTDIRYPALAVLPLVSGGEAYGAISLSFDQPREFDPEERAFLYAATQQTAHAFTRAMSYEEERAEAERQRFLAEAGELLTESLDPDVILQRLAELAVEHIADWCGVELREGTGELRNVAVAHIDPGRVALAHQLRERYPTDPASETGAPNVIRTGQSELFPEIPDELLVEAAENEEHLALLRELGLSSAMTVPLRARGEVFGAISFVASDPSRRYDQGDLAFAEDLARTAALAVDNARLFRREHEAALTLQRSLLPQTLPQVAGLDFAAHYHPAAPGSEVGGDWYEVMGMDDGSVALTIGDVAGRGIAAASTMGRIRPALGAYVRDGHGPHQAVERLDTYMREFEKPEMTTLFHLHCNPATGEARFIRAGHPPALLRLENGEVRELRGVGSPPLGIFDDLALHENPAELPPGSLLLLYTDGLIERRESDVVAGLERLKSALARAPADASGALDSVETAMEITGIPDDVATLAMLIGEP